MNTSVKTHKDMLDIPPYYKSRNINRASISELTPIANFMKRMSQQLIAEQSKLWAREDFTIVRDSLHVTKRIAYLNTYIHACLTTRQDLLEEGEVQSFRVKNDTVLVLVAADIVDMCMSITKQFVLSTVDEYLLARVDKHTPGTPGRKAAEAFQSTYMQLAIFWLENFFIYTLAGDDKLFYRQLSGLPVGASYSDSIASLGVVLKKALMYKHLTLTLDMKFAGAAELVMKARFADDNLLALLCPKDQVAHVMASLQEAFSDMHPCLSFTFVHETYFLLGDKKKTPQPFPFLELNLLPILFSDRTFIIQHTVNVKDSSAYSITPYSSAHPDSVKIAKVTTSRHRLITLSSTEQYFEDSWLAYCFRLFRAGYPVALVKSHEGGRLWKN